VGYKEESNKTHLFSADPFTVPGSIDLEFYSLKTYFNNGGGRNMAKKTFLILFLVFALMFPVVPCGWTQPKSGTHSSVITHSFAVDKGQYGFIWKI